jgi:hypothetical protein
MKRFTNGEMRFITGDSAPGCSVLGVGLVLPVRLGRSKRRPYIGDSVNFHRSHAGGIANVP